MLGDKAPARLRLLSETDRHPKMSKNGKVGVLLAILHLAPHNVSGYNVCPMASEGCIKSCLHYSGMQYARKYAARIARTKWFFEDRSSFMAALHHEIWAVRKKAAKLDLRPNIRLNGTSDIPWEKILWMGGCIMDEFPDVAFHDYTKRSNRRDLPDNYKLVFSRSENNGADCLVALKNGMNVAVVFADRLPETHWNYPVIDGDEHDFRYGDYEIYPERVIVGLRAKGKLAKQDKSGFVVRV